MRKSPLAALLLTAGALAASATAGAPPVQATAFVVQSSLDGRTLAARSSDEPRAMASLTKLMTALVAREQARLDERVTITTEAARVGESTLDLRAGERVTVRDLLIGTLVPSANDAATALALHVGKGSLARFTSLMNARARALGLDGTTYRNPHGLDEPRHVSTARDSVELLRVALRDPVIRRYVRAKTATLSDGTVVESTDNLITVVPGFVGGKTGHTIDAGWSQVAAARKDGVTITAAVLGEPSEAQRDRDLSALLRWGLASYRLSTVIDSARTYAVASVGWGLDPVRLVARRTAVRPASTTRTLTERVTAPVVVALPIRKGQQLGELVVLDGPRVVARSPLVASRGVAAPGLIARSRFVATRTIDHLVGLVR